LTAKAEPGWGFAGWDGNLAGPDNPVSIVLDGDKTITAKFTQSYSTRST